MTRDNRPDKSIPMPFFDWPILGNLVTVAINSIRGIELYDMVERTTKLGKYWIHIPALGMELHISDPPSIKALLEDLDSFALPPYRFFLFGELFGHGIFLSNGEAWNFQRNLAKPIFHLPSRTDMFETYHKAASHLLQVLDLAVTSGETIELQQLFKRFTLDTFSQIGFGYPLNSLLHPVQFSSSFDWIFKEVDNRMKFPWRRVTKEKEWRYHVGVIEEFIMGLIAERRKEGWEGKKDFLSRLLEMEAQKEITGVTEKFLKDQVMNFMIAGRDTTAVLLAATFYFLLQSPECEEKVAREIEEVVGKEVVTMNHTKELRYLKNVLDEALRLFPPAVPVNSRICLKDVVLPNKVKIRKGGYVSYSPFVVHRLKEFWGEDADEFKPERWEDKDILKHPYQFVPFQKGPRQCLGMNMAYEEAKCCIAILYQSGFRFKLLNKENPLLHNMAAILTARNGINVKVQKIN
uniref:Cytochrome P450 n=1 Tax=Arcella intermedia TaxID=1963864 RepID=A0A6B2L364_9EUKA